MKRISIYFIMLVAALSLSIGVQAKPINVTTAGTLSSHISQDEQETLTELVVSGPLNGDDILIIRAMASNLEILDMSGASIVAGGASYYATDNFTTNDVIGDKMFYSMTGLKKLLLPNSITRIGTNNYDSEAIARCVNLESVTLPSSLTYIGYKAFNYCIRLKTVQIPEGVTRISKYAFLNCKSLTSVSLPTTLGQAVQGDEHTYFLDRLWTPNDYVIDYNSPRSEYSNTFEGCDNLSEVIMPEGLEALTPFMFDDCKSLVSVKLPSTMKVLNGAFKNTGITEIILPEGLIQVNSFEDCTQLKSISIPEGAGYLSYRAFKGCASLISVELPQSTTAIPTYAFQNCTSLSSITIPDKVSTISSGVFYECTSLATVTLPPELTSIDESAFYNCSKLTTIELPAKTNRIGQDAFCGCTLLESINFPSSIVTIGSNAFQDCISLKSAQLPPNLTEISYQTFNRCKSLKTVNLPSGLLYIKENAFYNCESLEEITIPGGVQEVLSAAFFNCGLKKVILQMGIISIEDGAFSNCQKLEEVVFPESMTTIGGFRNTGIKSIVFPKNTIEIGKNAFMDCDSLRSVIIPEGITNINPYAFAYCDSLKTVSLPSTLKEIGEYAFQTTNLKEITIPEGVEKIKQGTFYGCDSLEIARLPESLTEIINSDDNTGAFSRCTQLKTINLPANLTELGSYTFSMCENLSKVTLPAGLKNINNGVFSQCKKLAEIEIPSNVTTIGEYAFQDTGLKDIDIPATVTSVGRGAFRIDWSTYLNGQRIYHCLNSASWNTTNDFPCNAFYRMNYLYVPEGTNVSDKSIAKYIFYNGVTDNMKIEAENGYFGISKEIKAKNVFYSKQFITQSGYAEPAGWRTIVLPFTVDKFTYTGNNWSDDGSANEPLAPFGSELLAQDETARPFWLYELTATGYQATTKIEANKPYLICMPNNHAYPENSNIRGWVRFSAENPAGVTLTATDGALQPSEGATYSLIPTYATVSKSEQVYTLNEENSFNSGDKDYPAGSVFIRNYLDVEPFHAYLRTKATPASAPRLYSIGGNGGSITGFENLLLTPDKATKAYSKNGVLYIESNAARTIRIYDASGRTIKVIDAQEGHNEVTGLADGIYFLEGQKVMVKK